MGSFYTSLSLPGRVTDQVRGLLVAWLSAKGFDHDDLPAFPDLDDENERGFFLFWNDRWTILLYSNFGERERVQFELRKLGLPLLHLWTLDSDAWGYELEVEGLIVTAFGSDPQVGAADGSAAPNDIERLLAECRIPLRRAGIRRIQRSRNLFAEVSCERFAAAIGAFPAATQYKYEAEEGRIYPAGFQELHLRFRRRDYDPIGSFDLHGSPGRNTPMPEEYRRYLDGIPPLESRRGDPFSRLPPIGRFVARLVTALLRISNGLEKLRNRVAPARAPRSEVSFHQLCPPKPPAQHVDGDYWVNESCGCRVRLAAGAAGWAMAGLLPFRIGDNLVHSKAVRAREARANLAGTVWTTIEKEENYFVGSLPAKMIQRAGQESGHSYRTSEIHLQGPRAVYFFHLTSPQSAPESTTSTFRQTVDTFELLR